jgi:uncharacterized damage-inducible protein DinB
MMIAGAVDLLWQATLTRFNLIHREVNMSIQEKLANLFDATNFVVRRQTAGLTHADSLVQPPFRGNCLNWVLGHILISRDNLLETLEAEPIQSAAARQLYQTNSEAITSDEQAMQLDQLLQEFDRSKQALADALAQKKADELSAIVDQDRNQSLEDRVRGFHWHETYHVGQLELLRQLAGKNDKIF